jgi:hypothetical protein
MCRRIFFVLSLPCCLSTSYSVVFRHKNFTLFAFCFSFPPRIAVFPKLFVELSLRQEKYHPCMSRLRYNAHVLHFNLHSELQILETLIFTCRSYWLSNYYCYCYCYFKFIHGNHNTAGVGGVYYVSGFVSVFLTVLFVSFIALLMGRANTSSCLSYWLLLVYSNKLFSFLHTNDYQETA